MQRSSAMHLPLDIYTLIGRNVAILLPLARLYDKRMMLVGDQRYTGASRNAIRFTSLRAARQGEPIRGRSIYFPQGFPSLSFRIRNAKITIVAPSVFHRKPRRGGSHLPFVEVWIENIKMYRT